MKASNYHADWADDPVLDKLAEYTDSYPLEDDVLADLDWRSEDDEIFFYQDVEELAETDFTDEALEAAFDGTLKVAHVISLLEIMDKNAKISTQEERVKMRAYRMKNKAMLARKSKIRRRKNKSGARRKKKRVGTAAGGYSYITSPTAGASKPKQQSSYKPVKMVSHQPTGYGNYNPVANTRSTEPMKKLKPL